MLSYKQWKTLNESILPSFNLGITNPSNLGIQSQSGFTMDLEETKKNSKKKMFGDEDDDEDEEEDEDETGDGEMVEPSSEKDEPDVDVDVDGEDEKPKFSKKCGNMCGAKSKKKSKSKCGSDVDDEDVDDEEGQDIDAESDDEGKKDLNSVLFSKKNLRKK
jgi:hypothetical protein